MGVDDVAGNMCQALVRGVRHRAVRCLRRQDGRAWQILLATSSDVFWLKKRGIKIRVDDVASSIYQALEDGGDLRVL